MNRSWAPLFMVAITGLVAIACSSTPPPPPEPARNESELSAGTNTAWKQFLDADPSLKEVLDQAAGYAILPDITKAAAILGAAYGKGEVYEKGVKIGYCELSMGSVGAQIGGEAYSELIVFHDQKALDEFKTGELKLSASATAVALKPGAARVANRTEGTSVFVRLKGGLMAEAAIGGQRIKFRPL